MQADTIFIISDGAPIFQRALFGKELEEYQKKVAEAQERWAKVMEKDREKIDKANKESTEKYWKEVDAENAKRARHGLPPKVFEEGGPVGLGMSVGRPTYPPRRRLTTFEPSRPSYTATTNESSQEFTRWPMGRTPPAKAFSRPSLRNFTGSSRGSAAWQIR